jgi:hypothetical protein
LYCLVHILDSARAVAAKIARKVTVKKRIEDFRFRTTDMKPTPFQF